MGLLFSQLKGKKFQNHKIYSEYMYVIGKNFSFTKINTLMPK